MEIIEVDGTQLKFSKLTNGDEDEWKDQLRAQLLCNARADAEALELQGKEKTDFLVEAAARCAVGKCGLITELGLSHAMTPWGIIQILRLASRKHHPAPGIDDATINRLITERTEDVQRVLLYVLPGRLEKKATAGPKAGQPGTQ